LVIIDAVVGAVEGKVVLVGRTDDGFVGANIANMSAPAKQDYPNKANYTPPNGRKITSTVLTMSVVRRCENTSVLPVESLCY